MKSLISEKVNTILKFTELPSELPTQLSFLLMLRLFDSVGTSSLLVKWNSNLFSGMHLILWNSVFIISITRLTLE